jgi:DNA-binding winged helix-turn-helix (wHTH) protein
MTVIYRSPPHVHHLHRLSRQGQIPVIELDQNLGIEPPAATTKEQAFPAGRDLYLRLPVLREMLESDSYQVALVPRGERDHTRGSWGRTFSATRPTLLLPFSWKELVAQVVPNSNFLAEFEVVRFEDICVDFTKMKVSRSSGPPIILTTQEFKTLKCFLLNPDRVFSRSIVEQTWGYDSYPSSCTVDNHVLRLRKLQTGPSQPGSLRTVHNTGYKFVRSSSPAVVRGT